MKEELKGKPGESAAPQGRIFHAWFAFRGLHLCKIFCVLGCICSIAGEAPSWFSQPLSLAQALDIAFRQNPSVLKAAKDMQAAHGIAIQTRAIAIPKLQASGNFIAVDPGSVEQFPFGPGLNLPDKTWSSSIRVVQSVYEGGRMQSSIRTARLTREQALLSFDTILQDVMAAVRVSYYDVLAAAEQVRVQQASVALLTRQFEDVQTRVKAGSLPQFNALRAEVELANAKPRLIRARNAERISKQNLANLLGYSAPKELEDLPLALSDKLAAEPYALQLSDALTTALGRRTELAALRKSEQMREENVKAARAGYKPSLQLFAGYGVRNSAFYSDLTRELYGWSAGAQGTWNIFDGGATRGRVMEARALHEKAGVELDEMSRRIELEVRTAFSNLVEARELLESQMKVIEQAEEALRLAESRFGAGSATQLDILSAQTALTDARSTQVQALHDYAVARARLERTIGQPVLQGKQ